VKPPFILVEKKYLAPSTVFLPLKAVYGFRRSPRLWGTHRDHKMRQLEVKVKRGGDVIHVMLSQLGSEPNLWKVVQVVGEEEDENATLTNGRILGLVMTYVDDIFVSGQDDVAEALIGALRDIWTTTEPQEVTENPIKFLGMEVAKVWSNENQRYDWFVTQESYVKDLLERYDQEKDEKKQKIRKVPISRDLAAMEEDPKPPSLQRVRQCQKEVGELLWLVTRTRPDLMFSIARMGANVTKATAAVLEAAAQTRDYLRGTVSHGLKFGEEREKEVAIQVWSDASFAPEGEESHGCFTVMVNQSVLFWRSGRQPSITLSTAEAELNELIEGMNAGEAVSVILQELLDEVKRIAWSDSQSAIAILTSESGSWRTRHLRMRAAYAKQAVFTGDWQVSHSPGEDLNADIGTKALTSVRLEKLKSLLCMASKPSISEEAGQEGPTEETSESRKDGAEIKVAQAALAVKLLTMAAMISVGKSQEDEEEETESMKEFNMMMVAFAILIVLLTLLVQAAWKVGVGVYERRTKGLSDTSSRSLPAQSESGEGQRAQRGRRGSGGEDGSSGSGDRLVQLPPEIRDEVRGPVQPDELGLVGGEPVRLSGPEDDDSSSSWSSEGSTPEGQDLGNRIEGALQDIALEEAELWRQIRLTPLPPVLIEQVEEDPNEGLGFTVLRTRYGQVYHSSLTCRHLQGARVSLPQEFKWCQTCRRVALQTRGRPIPGSPLYLSISGEAAHTDERCPWINEMKQTPFCLTCREREGVV
jgi:hypothetical protein